MTEPEIGYLLALVAVGHLLVVQPAGRTADRTGRRPVIVWGLVAIGLGSLVLSVSAAAWLLFITATALGVAHGYANICPPAVIADAVPVSQRGSMVGANRTMAGIGLAIGPVTTGFASDVLGLRSALAVTGTAVVVLGLAMFTIPETFGAGSAPKEAT